MNLRVAICDDETLIAEEIKEIIGRRYNDYDIDIYNSGISLFEAEQQYDIVLLDIEMPDMDGMSIAKKMRANSNKVHIIFFTGHDVFMQEAFKVKAFRFLKKPVGERELYEALSDAEKEIFNDKRQIMTEYGTDMLVNVSDILYIESERNKTVVHTIGGEIKTNNRLKYWLDELGGMDFVQVHKTYVVSMRHVRRVDEESVMLAEGNIKIPVARRKYVSVRNAFYQYVTDNANYM